MRFEQLDLPTMIADLVSSGKTYREIIAAMGEGLASEATIRYWRQGGQPRLTPGLAFVRMWESATGRSMQDAPRVPYAPMRRAQTTHTSRPHCPHCGQAMRGDRAVQAEQLDAFRAANEQFSWPPVANTESASV